MPQSPPDNAMGPDTETKPDIETKKVSVTLKLMTGYQFQVDFGDAGQLITDEPPPLGDNAGPNPSKLLIAAVANCLGASLLFAVHKFNEDAGPISARVEGVMTRAQSAATTPGGRSKGRWRISHIDVTLKLGNASVNESRLARALSQFEDFCVVTQSVRQGIDITVNVEDARGQLIDKTH